MATIKKSTVKKSVAKKPIKKAQEGENVKPTFFKSNKDKMSMKQLDKSFDDKQYRPTDGSAYTTSHANKTKFLSEDKNYAMKEKYEDENNPNKRTSSVQRRTLKGFLSGAPRATGKANVDDKGNLVSFKKGGTIKKKMKNSGSLSGLKGSAKRVGPVDPKGAFTKVQKKTLAGAKGKASLTKDKQLGATKMAKRGMSIKKK